MKIFTINEAIESIRKYHNTAKIKPVLVSVHGSGQNAGKSYFCKKALEKLAVKDKINWGVYFSNDPYFDYFLGREYQHLNYLFYHVGYNWYQPANWSIINWNRKIMPFVHRNVDLSVFIFNPNFTNPNLEKAVKIFDFVVRNPKSKKKYISFTETENLNGGMLVQKQW